MIPIKTAPGFSSALEGAGSAAQSNPMGANPVCPLHRQITIFPNSDESYALKFELQITFEADSGDFDSALVMPRTALPIDFRKFRHTRKLVEYFA